MRKRISRWSAWGLTLLFLLAIATPVLAQPTTGGGNPTTGGGNPTTGGGNPTTGGGNSKLNVPVALDNPFRVEGDLFDLIKEVVDKVVLPIGGVLCVLAFIYAGFMYVTARGDSAKIKLAHNALLYSAIGTAVLLGSWVIANAIRSTVGEIIR